jgi:hypothetical protein
MSIKQFKDEFRTICTDTSDDAIDAWFECAGRLYKNGVKLPILWEYKPPVFGSPCSKESPFYESFKRSTIEELQALGRFIFRYCIFVQYFKNKFDDTNN